MLLLELPWQNVHALSGQKTGRANQNSRIENGAKTHGNEAGWFGGWALKSGMGGGWKWRVGKGAERDVCDSQNTFKYNTYTPELGQ